MQRIETAAERDRLQDEMNHLEAEWNKVRHEELPRALRDMQRLESEVEMLRKHLFSVFMRTSFHEAGVPIQFCSTISTKCFCENH